MKRAIALTIICSCLGLSQNAKSQDKYEPIHGASGYDYTIGGELELTFSNSIDFKNGNKIQGDYKIKSPIVLTFNRNDLKFFKAQPKEFAGYIENQYDARSGFPGGLFEIPQGSYGEEENWMQVETHFESKENDLVSTINAKGKICPFLKVNFSVPDFPEKLKSGMGGLQFRLMISGIADSKYNPQKDVTGKAVYGTFELTDGFDIPVSVTCGTFYGSDLVNALIKNNLAESSGSRKKEFESRFEKSYFGDLPRINAIRLIDFLIRPAGNYEVPISGSFFSDSESGSEKASYSGKLILWGNKVTKNE